MEPSNPNFKTFIAAALGKAVNVENLSPTDPLVSVAKKNAAYFTCIVDGLRSKFPIESIRNLAAIQWDMVGHQMTPTAIGPVPTLSFTSMGNSAKEGFNPAVLMPPNWYKMCDDDLNCQIGAVVFVGSQIRDYYNGKIFEKEVVPRSHAYEAEYLVQMRKLFPDYRFNDYQKKVLRDFPQGLASLPTGVQYESKPWVQGGKSGIWPPASDPQRN